ncbi:EamA family transporter [bacterium]|nr:EamA family transporter [bacterium]
MADPARIRTASVVMFLGASVWGLYWLPLRALAEKGVDGAWAAALFNACPLIVMGPVLIRGRKRMLARPGPALFVGAATGLGMGLFSTAVMMAPIIRMTMEFYLTPVWSTIIGVLWLSERLDARRIVTVLCGLGGLGLLLAVPASGAFAGFGLGDVLALTSGVFWALGAAGMKHWPEISVVASSTFQFVFAVLIAAVLGLVLLAEPIPSGAHLLAALPLCLAAATLMVLPSIYAVFWAGRLLYPGRAAILMMSEVLMAALSASWLLPKEVLSPQQWLGAAIVLAACVIGR